MKLTTDDIRVMRAIYNKFYLNRHGLVQAIAANFGVCVQYAGEICRGKCRNVSRETLA